MSAYLLHPADISSTTAFHQTKVAVHHAISFVYIMICSLTQHLPSSIWVCIFPVVYIEAESLLGDHLLQDTRASSLCLTEMSVKVMRTYQIEKGASLWHFVHWEASCCFQLLNVICFGSLCTSKKIQISTSVGDWRGEKLWLISKVLIIRVGAGTNR